MTAQEIFDQVANHLLTQNKQSKGGFPATQCLYRGPGGLKCAIGVLIPDNLYKPGIEQIKANQLCYDDFLNKEGYTQQQQADLAVIGFTADNAVFLDGLQYIHDNFKPGTWRDKLANFAEGNGLNLEAIC